MPVRRRAAGARCSASRCASAPTSSGTATFREARPGSSTATACTAPTTPSRGTASTRTSSSSIPTRAASSGRSAGATRYFGYTRRPASARTCRSTGATARAAMPKCQVIDRRLHAGATTAARTPLERHGHLRAARARLHDAPSRTCRRRCGHLRRASPRPGRSTTSSRLGVTAVELHARARSSSTTAAWSQRGLTQLLGLQHHRLLRPRRALSALGRAVTEFKTMVKTLHPAGLEVILDVVYNHTGEGNQLGPDAVLSRHRQLRLLPARAGGPALLRRLHRLRQHAQPASTRACCSSSWTACATG